MANGDRYRAMLNEFLFTEIEEQDIGKILFQLFEYCIGSTAFIYYVLMTNLI